MLQNPACPIFEDVVSTLWLSCHSLTNDGEKVCPLQLLCVFKRVRLSGGEFGLTLGWILQSDFMEVI